VPAMLWSFPSDAAILAWPGPPGGQAKIRRIRCCTILS